MSNVGRKPKFGITDKILQQTRENLNPSATRTSTQYPVNDNSLTRAITAAKGQLTAPENVAPPTQYSVNNNSLTRALTAAKSQLKAPEKEQRYIVSPHKDIRNFLNNARGMGKVALREGHNVVRPVFKNEEQREAFHQAAVSRLSNQAQVTESDKLNFGAYKQLVDWSHKDNAMMNFDSVNSKRSHPIVFVQGHGRAGVKSISSDDKSEARVSAEDVAKQLTNMNLPKVSEVRANSCYSGTEVKLKESMPDIQKHFKQGNIASQHAGNWENTFAGDLQSHLEKGGFRHRVQGYLGPTSQGPVDVKAKGLGDFIVNRNDMRVKAGNLHYYKGNMRRHKGDL